MEIVTSFRIENCNFTVLATASSEGHKKNLKALVFLIREANSY